MFAATYFAPRYFAPRYFPEIGSVVPVVVVAGKGKKRKLHFIRLVRSVATDLLPRATVPLEVPPAEQLVAQVKPEISVRTPALFKAAPVARAPEINLLDGYFRDQLASADRIFQTRIWQERAAQIVRDQEQKRLNDIEEDELLEILLLAA